MAILISSISKSENPLLDLPVYVTGDPASLFQAVEIHAFHSHGSHISS